VIVVALDYEWRLRVVMAERGMFNTTDLQPRLVEHGIRLSDSQVWRLVTGKPERLSLQVLIVLCEILACEPGELIRRHEAKAPMRREAGSSARQVDKDLKPRKVRLRRPGGA
jgi:DNA-binding Xre family transcriptional regulator